jgi:hypothetical protein
MLYYIISQYLNESLNGMGNQAAIAKLEARPPSALKI